MYRLHEGGASIVLDGMTGLRAFYKSLVDADALVCEQDVAVADRGFAAEVVFEQFMPRSILGDSVFSDVSGPTHLAAPPVLLRRTLSFVWPYDVRRRRSATVPRRIGPGRPG